MPNNARRNTLFVISSWGPSQMAATFTPHAQERTPSMVSRVLGILLLCSALLGAPTALAQRVETGFLDRAVTVGGIEYRYEVYVPRDYDPARRWPGILARHGGGEPGSDGILPTVGALAKAIRQHPDRFPAIVVFPHAHADGTPVWQGPSGQAALVEVDRALAEFHGDSSRVYLTGYSAGGNGGWYLAYHYPQRFRAAGIVFGWVPPFQGRQSPLDYPSIPPISAADPYAEVARGVAGLPIWLVHGDADKNVSVDQSRHMYAALKTAGADVHYTELPGVDHSAWDPAYQNPDIAAWLFKQHRATVPIQK